MRGRPTFALWPFTPAVKQIVIANGAIWLASVLLVVWAEWPAAYEVLRLEPGRVVGDLEIWRLATWMWVHDPTGLYHVLLNLLFLWMFGGTLEIAWGTRGFWRYYLLCGLISGVVVLLAGLLFDPETPVVGASGAIYGVVVAWIFVNPERRIWLFGVFPMKGKHFALIPIGFAVAGFLLRDSGVSHSAHLGGMAAGALLVTGYWRPRKLANRLRYFWIRRKLKIYQGGRDRRDRRDDDGRPPPPDGGYWQ